MSLNKETKHIWEWIPGGVGAPQGFWANGVRAGVKYANKYDLAVIYSDVPAQAAGVFTRNLVKAHPVLLSQKHIRNGLAQAIVINSGNANACLGETGDQAALAMTQKAADCFNLSSENILVASTGVIGVEMPLPTILQGIEKAIAELNGQKREVEQEAKPGSEIKIQAAHNAARAIMTTDLTIKENALEIKCQGGTIRLGAMAKGSGMIHPNMGTMLGFMTTDAQLTASQLQSLLLSAVEDSFNMVTIDGDTSTNDTVLFLANGSSGIKPLGEDFLKFQEAVRAMCFWLAQEIARDGEGATKFLEVQVTGAKTREDARKAAKSVCGASLVKTALFGEDANWGRIIAALGYSGADFDPKAVSIWLGDLLVARDGQGVGFSVRRATEILAAKDIIIKIDLQKGAETAKAWGCDLSYDYVKINGSYTT
ncbi:MAG: bifunctional glutamate N-acetyltransferase/amino-acid acetyltransferase ArgJ [Desulfitobacteriaceae bacterium]|nr:bifunctional glutamate N-acetyltransferase/amino-acid acetyltransferase ArgJ [Desulfitobacteriaceae bacterium]MDD4345389.1 bifunctional glutamate N-acetyltransferase/amino-acid acetyltransferase ArgJ [Desulfitobacteriaceae bacterium]MDD4401498.1 bifunctional glutamate N-acetyltransferase/amino-acid acetyltransferase ArgJ [Desulfitobacteriaceae bacterium]